MKIVNRTTVPFPIEVYLFVPASSLRAEFVLGPNQMEVFQFNDPTPVNGSLSVYEVYRFSQDKKAVIESFAVPAGATVIFSSEIQTGVFGTN